MPRKSKFSGCLALVAAMSAMFLTSASAELLSGRDQPDKMRAVTHGSGHAAEIAAQTVRPHITIHPRHVLGPHAVRHCRFWLAKEYRISGPVVVPQQRCWWN